MIHFEREVVRTDLIEAILKEIHIANVGMMDEDGYPYIVPMNFGFEINEEKMLTLAEEAAELGIELLVMDDGWFKG